MNGGEKSLRRLVDKWFAPTPAMPVRVKRVRFSRTPTNDARCICVESARPAGPLAIFFFQHGDGSWSVFPPELERPAMQVS